MVEPSARAKGVLRDVGDATGPYGRIATDAALGVITAIGYYMNRRAISKHIAEQHTGP